MKKFAMIALPAVWLAFASCGSSVVLRDPSSPLWLLDGVGAATKQVTNPPPQGRYEANLASILELAGARPFAIAIARAAAEEQLAIEGEALSGFLPAIRPRAGFFRHEGAIQETGGAFLDIDKQNNTLGGAAELTIDPGEAYYRASAEAQRSVAGRHQIFAAQQGSVATAIGFYYEMLKGHNAVKIAEEALKHADEFVAVEKARKDQGVGLEAHVLRALAHKATNEGELARSKAQLTQHTVDLVAHLRLPAGVELIPQELELVPFDLTGLDGSLEEMFLHALKSRPELEAARALVEAARIDKAQAAYAWLLPRFRADSSYDGFGRTMSGLRGRENYSVGLEWEFNFGIPSRNRRARAKLRTSQLQLEALKVQIHAQIHKARARREASGIRLAAARREVLASTEALRLVSERHKGGRALLVEVLDTQLADTRAKNALVAQIAAYNQAQLELKLAIGATPSEK